MRIGISYDTTGEYAHIDGPEDRFAEFEPESTIEAMEDAIRSLNFTPVRIGGPFTLLHNRPEVDLIWNISEGYGTRNREAWVPVLCELYDIPYIGSDALSLSLSLDKAASKQVARNLHIPTSDWCIASFRKNEIFDLSSFKKLSLPEFPLFLKPRYEGTAKGISEKSVVRNLEECLLEVRRLQQIYAQDILIERFLPGPEYTVAVTGTPMSAHPVLERGLDPASRIGLHVIDGIRRQKETPETTSEDYLISGNLSPETERNLQRWSVLICEGMQVHDFARLDFKADEHGNPYFLEINPLPTFAVDNTLAILAELEGLPYTTFLSKILDGAVQRVNSKSR